MSKRKRNSMNSPERFDIDPLEGLEIDFDILIRMKNMMK